LRLEEELSVAHLRLARVYIENMPYATLIERFDRPHTFFYLDPPYYGFEDCYGKDIFSRNDFIVLRDLLSTVTGKWVLSINDVPEIRQLFGSFLIREVNTTYTASGAHRKKSVTELLIMNFDPPG
jgi:DNA adenine methylase